MFVFKYPVLDIGYHQYELASYVPNGISLAEKGLAFYPIHRDYLFHGHSQLFPITLAISYKIFGIKPFSTHLVPLIYSIIGLYYTFLCGKFLASKGKTDGLEAKTSDASEKDITSSITLTLPEMIGLSAALLLFFSPLYFAQSGIANMDLALSAMTIATYYYYLRRKWIGYVIASSIMVLIKEPGTIIIPILLFDYLFQKQKKTIK
ncbi:MAG: glycosyltransferase family 39 protein, partial [Candidatus Altiarchaeota archaeon]|nr:glycosyltransferase family 39 protein [Candidatus Altiarchaeota archaeon]